MAKIEYVKEIDDLIPIKTVFATATDKSGLVDNINKKDGSVLAGVPENGIIGVLFDVNPDALVISTGGTAGLIEKAGFKVMPVGEFTGWPEMLTGLVKSMQAKLYVGMLAHRYTESDLAYMQEHEIPSIDMTLANFYPFEEAVAKNPLAENPLAFEIIRQNMDVGGPTSVHTSRKGFLGTAVTTRPEDYAMFISDLRKYAGCISLDSRVIAMKHCTKDLARYYTAIDEFMESVDTETVRRAYPTINNPAEE
ncbi:hypothetical protein KY338_06850 [Candidatus Woesearchaeota archaeon]|nr:hypothetical protein [Candidatus Woesearchaeota archaeon]MBW3006378.1 hypothetical protein [Candidatus Woesearchaeota archaeon]